MHATLFPGADHTTQWYGKGNYTMPGIDKLLLHTTEGTGWPTYDGGLKAPTLTFNPGARAVRQHFPLNGSARALRDPTSTPVRENRDNVVQVEIIGFAAKSAQWDAWTVNTIADLWVFLNAEWGTPLTAIKLWVPATPWGTDSQRLSSVAYDAFAGLLGHEHAPGNDHRDPGKPDIATIVERARGMATNPAPISPTNDGNRDARITYIYSHFVDSDGSPSIPTRLVNIERLLAAIEAKLP